MPRPNTSTFKCSLPVSSILLLTCTLAPYNYFLKHFATEVTCWPTKELKQKLVAKRQYIYHKDRLQVKILQKYLDKEIQLCKQNYKRKLEANFSEGNSRQAWKGLQASTGYKKKPKSFSNISSADAKELCANLNTFYARFDSIKTTILPSLMNSKLYVIMITLLI